MKIVILGIGNMGSWLAKELSKENEIAIYDQDKKKTAKVKNAKVLSELSEIKEFGPEMLVNAVSLQNTIEAFESTVKYTPEECVICDVASIKKDLPGYYKKCGRKFASLHPMFGPTFANMDSLKEESLVIIKESDGQAANFFRWFFGRLGLKLFEYTFKEHDNMMAYSLTTPFAASLVFAACVDDTTVPGTTFARHRKLAKGLLSEDDHLLAEVLFNPESIGQLERITSRLEFLKHVIRDKDYDEARKFFDKLRKNIE
ncbi:prephenate dehydrogenase/arogenate dehydrogenase family protein [Candidatus Micrarchaeota archaeon]|nr:prephenate dehydrogenase/arogenate dehydrogenase family protein [Candidatus Micrarchaeota archaeon]